PWASAGEVTIANGGDIAKRFSALPPQALIPESDGNQGGGTSSLPSLVTASFQLPSVQLMRWANNGTLAVATENSILLYDTNALDSSARQLPGDMENITSLAISPDSLWLAAGLENGQILLWSLANNDPPNVLADHTWAVKALAFSPNSNLLLSGGGILNSKPNGLEVIQFFEDTEVRVWDVKTGSKIRQLSNPKGQITTLGISADGTTVMAGTNDVD
ncbi:MAG: WD40 repeat domain-containing protein, partial [Ardenticatenaceae bacterium]